MQFKKTLLIMMFTALAGLMAAQSVNWRLMDFQNPGTRRILRSEAGNHFYYRSLPERSMRLAVEPGARIQLRSMAKAIERRPQVTVIMGSKRETYDLVQTGQVGSYTVFEPINLTIPEALDHIEVLCYSRNIYFRAYYAAAPRRTARRTPSLVLREHSGQVEMKHNGDSSTYYSFDRSQDLKFEINNNRMANLYVRAKLVSREPAVFELYHNGSLVERVEFDLRRTGRYSIEGVDILSIGKKIELRQGGGEYTLKAVSNNLFFGRPVILSNP